MTTATKIVHIDPRELRVNYCQPDRRTKENALRPLEKSVSIHGILNPLAVTEDKILLDGHRRHAVSIKLGFKTVPCVVHSGLSAENFGLLNITTKSIGSGAWMEAFVKSKGGILEMPARERRQCNELLKIFGSYNELDRWFVTKGQGSNSVLQFIEQLTNMFAANGVSPIPSKKQIGCWILFHDLAWVTRNLIKDLLKGKSNTGSRLKRLAKKISRNEAIDDEF